VVYNHLDSYPSFLGMAVVRELKRALKVDGLKGWTSLLKHIKIVDEDKSIPPTDEEIEELCYYADLQVKYSLDSNSLKDWYSLLRRCEGSLNAVLSSGYLLNHVNEDGTPIWQEYAYIVNLDSKKLDFYDHAKLSSYNFDSLPDWSKYERLVLFTSKVSRLNRCSIIFRLLFFYLNSIFNINIILKLQT
jgi:hypothetical protein